MKIGNHAELPAVPVAPATTPGSPTAPTTSAAQTTTPSAIPASADPSATLELSSTASTLLSTGDPAEFDSAKVDRISKSIDDGTYKVNPEAIADKLISNAQELLSKVQPSK
jgi:negative regulator of flagellin synthesis FlgM